MSIVAETQRGTGRTTRMLTEVLDRVAAGEKGALVVLADSPGIARVCLEMFVNLARERNYSPAVLPSEGAVVFASARVAFRSGERAADGYPRGNVFLDHYRREQVEAGAFLHGASARWAAEMDVNGNGAWTATAPPTATPQRCVYGKADCPHC